MLRSPLNLFRTGRSPSPTEPPSTGRSPGSSPGTSPRTSPAHAELSSRGRPGDDAAQPSLRPRRPNILARLTRTPPLPAAVAGSAGPSAPQRPHAGSGQSIERDVAQWKQEAVAQLPRVHPVGINYIDHNGNDTRQQNIDSAAAAVISAAATNAHKLQLQYLPTTSLPPSIGNLAALKELDLSFNAGLTKVSENIANLKELTKLSVLGSPLESLPTAIGGLPKLATLNLSGGSYETLPLGFTRLAGSLKNLDISHSRPARGGGGGLKELPDNIGALKLLQNLKLSGHKQLAEVPAGVGDLTQLRTLDLSNCPKLTNLPDLSTLRNLKTLNLSGCTGLSARPEWLNQLPRGCEVILPTHLTEQRPVREAVQRPARFQPRPPEEAAQRGQKLVDWVAQLQPFTGERGAGRFNLWMGAMVRREGQGPADMGQLNAVVKAATASPAFRAELFAFAAASVKIPRNEAGMQQPAAATVGNSGVQDAHGLLIKHQISDPQTNPRHAYKMLRQMALDPINSAFPRELMAFNAPGPGGAGSRHAHVPKLLEAYVKTHDQEGKAIMETMRSLENRHGSSSGSNDAATRAAAMQPLDELLRGRYLAVAKQLQSLA